MKIRQGFVSNSSSSSFVIIGKELKWDMEEVKFMYRKVLLVGPGWDYTTCFEIKTWKEFCDLRDFLRNDEKFSNSLISAAFYNGDCDGAELDMKELAGGDGKWKVWSGEADNYPNSVENMIRDLNERDDR